MCKNSVIILYYNTTIFDVFVAEIISTYDSTNTKIKHQYNKLIHNIISFKIYTDKTALLKIIVHKF